MTFSPLIARSFPIPASQRQPRQGVRVDTAIIHHAASASDTGTLATIQGTARTVSYNYLITRGGEIWGLVPEGERALSTANPGWDRRAINICMVNQTAAAPWPTSDATRESAAYLLADLNRRLGVPLNRTRVLGHREIRATLCPGAANIDQIVQRAAQLNAAPPQPPSGPTSKGQTMYLFRTTNGAIWLFTDQGRVHIRTTHHVTLFQRMFRTFPNMDTFNATERDIVWNYILAARRDGESNTRMASPVMTAILAADITAPPEVDDPDDSGEPAQLAEDGEPE